MICVGRAEGLDAIFRAPELHFHFLFIFGVSEEEPHPCATPAHLVTDLCRPGFLAVLSMIASSLCPSRAGCSLLGYQSLPRAVRTKSEESVGGGPHRK